MQMIFLLSDLFLVGLNYDRDKNFYVYKEDLHFLGTLNRKVLRKLNISAEMLHTKTLEEICAQYEGKLTDDVVQISGPVEDNIKILCEKLSIDFPISDEIAAVDKESGRLVGVFKRKDIFHECYPAVINDNITPICYREKSHYYVRKENCENLNQYAENITSQYGEDGIISAIFDRIGTTSRYGVEFGAWDGIHLSNIRNLIINKAFGGLLIEGDEERGKALRETYKDNKNVRCLTRFVEFEGENTLDNLLDEVNAPSQIDLLSIDIDGCDYHVWKALKKYRPRVLVIEYNPTIQNDVIFINPRNESASCGSSAAALVELGRQKRYLLAAVTRGNLIFVVEEEYDKLEIWDNDLEMLRGETRRSDGRFFQTFDGQVILTGRTDYIWGIGRPRGHKFRAEDGSFVFSGI